jgi:hypothetical protein
LWRQNKGIARIKEIPTVTLLELINKLRYNMSKKPPISYQTLSIIFSINKNIKIINPKSLYCTVIKLNVTLD